MHAPLRGRAIVVAAVPIAPHFESRVSPRKINSISVVLLTIGFGVALAIYLTVPEEVVDPVVEGIRTSKKYMREMRVIGGSATLMLSDFAHWFAGFWHGRALGGTVAVLTLLGTGIFRFVAARPDIYAPDRVPEEKSP